MKTCFHPIKPFITTLVIALFVSLGAANAATVSYVDAATLAAHSGVTTTIDFNGGMGETYFGKTWTTSGVTFDANNEVFHLRSSDYDGSYHSDGYVDLQGSILGLTFASAVTSLGFNFGAFYSEVVHLSITLGNNDVFSVTSPYNGYGYFGVTSDVAFNSLTITTTNRYTALDNVTFGAAAVEVPEPSSLMLLGLGIFGFVAARHRNAR